MNSVRIFEGHDPWLLIGVSVTRLRRAALAEIDIGRRHDKEKIPVVNRKFER
jgi:hypothetical protein